jgi:hypothetical protein
MLDETPVVHSLWRADQILTGGYFDYAPLLGALSPPGPLSLLGLGAGTCARLLQAHCPERQLHAWEHDAAVLEVAREHMGLGALEAAGLRITVGDALAPAAALPGGSAGIFVDLITEGQLPAALMDPATWRALRGRLAPGGRLLAHLGQAPRQAALGRPSQAVLNVRDAMRAIKEAFDGEICMAYDMQKQCMSTMALSGPLPDPAAAGDSLPPELARYMYGWERF